MNSLMIRASAGSGKTFQLSNRFLALLAAGALPTELIALTFTRKAAGEFADRILSRLADGAMDDATALSLAGQLADTLIGNRASGMPPLHAGRELPLPGLARFRELLEGLARDLHRISLSTLDSFFVRIAKQFPYELGIGSFELLEADDLKAEKKQVLARIFREVTERQREAFLGAFRLATHGKEHTRLSALLDDFLDAHHQRFLNSPEREKWGDLSSIWPQGCPWPHLTDFHTAARNVIALLGTVVVPKKAHATWIKGWDTTADFFSTYQPGDGRNPPATVSRMLALLDDLRSGYANDLFNRIEHGIGGALAHAITDLIGGYLRAELEVRSTRTVGLWTILYAYESIYEQTVRLRGRLGFSDVTRVLAHGGVTADGRARMESRLDARYSHWLLDEFQDTSRSQWSVLAGLADEAVMDSEERRSLFVVGDTKQGIYGWRGGEPRLFDDLLGLPGWNQRMSEWSMETSWRSAPQVLALVNRICDPEGPGMRGRFPAAALRRWHFRPHLTSPGGENLPGYTAVVEAGESESDDEEG
ncbi:MAG: hypothetical protein JWO82_4244, partial [Akkermansiaceae bacterium]|nr:hypothetical protein [Akkermansiaceae bacterium]